MAIRTVRPSPVTPRGEPRSPEDDRRQIEALQRQTNASPTVPPGELLSSPRTDRQDYRLGTGEYKPVAPTATERVDVVGTGTGTVISPDQTIASPFVYYSGVRFTGSITVPATSVVMFVGCEITAAINIANGGRVHAVCCHFSGNGFLNNAGAAGNCINANCHKTSTPGHVNTTTVDQTV